MLPAGIRLDEETLAALGWVGVAVLWAQAMEQTLATYLVLARPQSITETRAQFRRSVHRANDKNLGELLRHLRQCQLPRAEAATLDYMSAVFRRRNNVAHHFLRRPSRRGLLATPHGRATLTAEAQSAAGEFRFWVFTLAPLVAKHAVRVGRRTRHLSDHADWLGTIEEYYGPLEEGQLAVAALDPTLALELAEMMERIESDSGNN